MDLLDVSWIADIFNNLQMFFSIVGGAVVMILLIGLMHILLSQKFCNSKTKVNTDYNSYDNIEEY